MILVCGYPHSGTRFMLDAELTPQDRPAVDNDADVAVEMLRRLLDENDNLLRPGLRGFLYDTAMSPEAIDKTLDLGVMPITPAPGSASGRHRRASLGDHTFTARDGTKHYRDVVVADDGSPAVVTTDSRGVETVVALHRQHIQWEHDSQRHIAYGRYMMPDSAPVPASLQGASTLIRLNSTDEEALGGSSMRRTRALRAIPETDPAFAVFKSRPYAESAVADLKHQAGSRLHASRGDVALSILTYQVLQLARA